MTLDAPSIMLKHHAQASCLTYGRTYGELLTLICRLTLRIARRGAEKFSRKRGEAVRDWEGSRIRAEAQQVPCRYCNARPGQPCTQKGSVKPLTAFPAHDVRIRDSQKELEP